MATHGTTSGEESALGLVSAHRDKNELATHEAAELGSYAGRGGRSSSIWSTSHHLQAAAEASAEISLAIKAPITQKQPAAGSQVPQGSGLDKAAKDINPAIALAILAADVAARIFCLSILWLTVILAVLASNAAVCVALIHRSHMSVEASLGIAAGFDMMLAAASIAFMARRFSTDFVRWGMVKLQPGRDKVRQLRADQAGRPFSGLRLDELQRKLRNKTEWAVAMVKKKIQGHATGEPPAAEAGDVPGVFTIEDDAEESGHGTIPCTSAGERGGKATGKAHEGPPSDIVNKMQHYDHASAELCNGAECTEYDIIMHRAG